MSILGKSRWSIGFGLERIGLLVLRAPIFASMALLLSLIISIVVIPRIGFDGNVVNVLNPQSKAYKDFIRQAKTFHDFSGDVSIIIKHKELNTAKVFDGLRDLHLDLTLEDGVQSVFSIFTLGEASKIEESSGPSKTNILPSEFVSDQQVRQSLHDLLQAEPAAGAIISPDKNAMMIMVRLRKNAALSDSALSQDLTKLRSSVERLAPPGTEFSFSGMPQIRASIVAAIISDQTVLTGAGILVGGLVAWFIFGTVRGAIICTVPALISVIWILACFAVSGTKLNFFTTALPTLALIIAFADTIVLYFRWQSINSSNGEDQIENLGEAVRKVGPASSLTSITTALAFASFVWAGSDTMNDLALFGVAAVSLAFLAVIIGLPLAGYWSVKLLGAGKVGRGPRFTSHGSNIAAIATANPKIIIAFSLVLLGCFSYAHSQLKPSYTLSEYLPYDSEIRASEFFADDVFGGTSQYYIIVPVTKSGVFNDSENRKRLIAVHEAVASSFGDKRTLSLASAWKRLSEKQISEIPSALAETSPSVRGRFVGKDYRQLQVSATTSSGESTLKVEERIKALRAKLDELSFGSELSITGLTVLLSKEFPSLIEDLRTGLLLSIFLAVVIIAVATRSPGLALASLVPNLIPILFTEAVIWYSGASLSVTNVIGLTIAFGIAIDNAVHVINSYETLNRNFETVEDKVRTAVGEIAPALIASTSIVCVAAIITQLSSMPSVAELGLLLIATLCVALLSNLAILPSAMILMLKATTKLGRNNL